LTVEVSGKASRALRDRFREALDADDYAGVRILSENLRNCTDILPRAVCLSLGLPRKYLRDSRTDHCRVMTSGHTGRSLHCSG